MARSNADKRRVFRALHEKGTFLLPNPWDTGSARLLEHLGFEALASTSTGYAWSTGRPDYAVTLKDVLEHLALLNGASDLPLNADFESGFAATSEELAVNIGLAIEAGVAGLSIEDRVLGDSGKLYDTKLAVERMQAARDAIRNSGEDVILVGRTEGLLVGGTVTAAIDKMVALAEAGADCLYAPGIGMAGLSTIDDAAALVRAVAPKPVNILVVGPGITLEQFAQAGVRRISVGGALAQAAWGGARDAARVLKDGSFEGLSAGMAGADLNALFGAYA